MKKIVWTAFGITLVLVNVIAEVGAYYTGIYIHQFFRIALIIGVTLGVTVLGGTFKLIDVLDQEKPLAGTVRDTLGADRKKT